MKILNTLKVLSSLLLLVLAMFSCDRIDEDVAPSTTGKIFLNDDFYITTQNQGIQINLLENDTVGGQAVIRVGKPAHGKLSPDSTQPGKIFYMPEVNFAGIDTFSYNACIGQKCASALVTILVNNDSTLPPPCNFQAINDFLILPENATDTVNVLTNDVACNLSPVITQQPINGTAIFLANSGILQYSPRQGFRGKDSLIYKLSDGSRNSFATVEFTVTAPPCTPVANPDSASVIQGMTRTVNVLLNDNACNVVPVISVAPQHGTATFISPGMLQYTPNFNYSGSDEIEYELRNALGASRARVRFAVIPNCTIQARMDSASMAAANDTISLNVLQNDNLCNGTQPVITILSQPVNGYAFVVQMGNKPVILYQKQPNAIAPFIDVIQYRVCVNVNGQQQCSSSNAEVAVY